ncbi:MAG TPA: hypothetical protein VEJ63_11385 [Planctomycetota bacterium]|nr:hypothetical protein [Planctomycetota bacterium]
MKTIRTGLTAVLILLCGSAAAATKPQPLEGHAPVDEMKLADYAWLKRGVKKLPAFKSQKIKYTWWALGNCKDGAALMAWDESGGTGKGYDTLYIDKNLNGDLTEAGECIAAGGKQDGMPTYDAEIVLPNGQGTFKLHCVMSAKGFEWQSNFSAAYPNPKKAGENVSYTVNLLPGAVVIHHAETPEAAPIYHLGGEAFVEVNGKFSGNPIGKWNAGQVVELSMSVGLYGNDTRHAMRFYHSNVGGASPVMLLRVLKPDGSRVEDVAFAGGCG